MPAPVNKSRRLWPALLLLIAVLLGAAAYLFYFDTYHFAVVQPGILYRMGMRNTRETENAIRQVHPKTVICLVSDSEVDDPAKACFHCEFTLLKDNGIALYRIPIAENKPPTPEQIDQFLRIVTDKQNQPAIVHCAQGVVRTGMMVAAYQRAVLGFTKQQAQSSVLIFGKGQERADEVQEFINHYYDAPQPLAASSTNTIK